MLCDVLVTDGLLQFWVGNQLLKTIARTGKGEIRKKHAQGTAPRAAINSDGSQTHQPK